MDVSCSRCGAEYEFEETLVSDRGTTVKCTSCGHLFKVFRPGQSPETVDESKPWLIRKTNGTVEPLVSLGDLTRLIAQGVCTAEDEISRTGQVWKRLGDIAELRGFFSASRRQQNQQSDTLVLGAVPPPTQETEVELPFGVAVARPQSQSGRANPPAPIPPGETEHKVKERRRRDTPNMWGGRPEAESTREHPEMLVRQLAARDGARQQQPPEASEPRLMDPGGQKGSEAETGVGKEAGERDSDQQLPTVKVKPVGSEASDPAPRRDPEGHGADKPDAQSASALPVEPPPMTTAVTIPMLDDEEEPASIPRSRIGWVIWSVLALLALGVGVWLWTLNPSGERSVEPTVVDRADQFIESGRKALDSHRVDRFSESITEFTKALAFRERDPRLLALLSQAYAVWAQSLRFRIMDAEASGDDGVTPEIAAYRYEVKSYTDRAVQYAERAARYGPESVEAMIASSDASRLKGELDEARVLLEKARMNDPSPSAELLRVEAMIAVDAADGDLKAGLESAREAVKKAPGSIRLLVLLARCLIAAEQRDDALARLEAILLRDPAHPETTALKNALEAASGSEGAAGAEPEAEEQAEAADRDEPDRAAREEESEDEASPSDLGRLVRRGERLLESGAIVRAEKLFRRVLDKKPNEPRALTGMGYVEIEKNRASRAIYYFQPAAKRGYPEAYIGLGDAYRRLGRKTDALRAYEAYVRSRPRGRLASIARAQIEQYRIEMRKKAEQHKLEGKPPSPPGSTGP